LDDYLGDGAWDVIHFNWGIHDITHLGEDGKVAAPPEGELQVPLVEYEQNIVALVERLKQTGATLIWASTTPIGMQTETKGYRRDRDVIDYNAAAARVMKAENILINDLYAIVKPRAEELLGDGVHFNDVGVQVLTDQVASVLRNVAQGTQLER
jgi:acyl-CoA thioesterase-1